MASRLRDVGIIYRFVSGGIADEHVRAHCRVGQHLRSVAGYVAQRDRYLLYISDALQVYRHRVPGEDGTSLHATCAARHGRAATHDIATEREYKGEFAVGAAAFHARLTGERQRNVEGSRGAMRFAGNRRGKGKAARAAEVTRQGKLRKLARRCGLKSRSDNLAVGLENGAVGSAIQVAK